jgi:hypothetical protein
MSDLKDYQSEQSKNISDTLLTTPETIYDFPSYWGFRINASYVSKRSNYSLHVGHNATGGRLHYSDYSGEIKIDKHVSNTNVSLSYAYDILNTTHFKLRAGLGVGVAFSTIEANNLVEIYVSEEKDEEITNYKGKQVFINPEASFVYAPLKFLFVELVAAYTKQVGSTEMIAGSDKLADANGDNVAPDWTGYRLGVGIGYKFNLKK